MLMHTYIVLISFYYGPMVQVQYPSPIFNENIILHIISKNGEGLPPPLTLHIPHEISVKLFLPKCCPFVKLIPVSVLKTSGLSQYFQNVLGLRMCTVYILYGYRKQHNYVNGMKTWSF